MGTESGDGRGHDHRTSSVQLGPVTWDGDASLLFVSFDVNSQGQCTEVELWSFGWKHRKNITDSDET